MRSAPQAHVQQPPLIKEATELATYVQSLTPKILQKSMHISLPLAEKTAQAYQEWNTQPERQSPAIDSFLGDIYSGLQASKLALQDRQYANEHLFILSGLYGVLRPLDGIMPYRLEMAYKLPNEPFNNLYKFWGDTIVKQLPISDRIVNLAAVEYSKTVLPYLGDSCRVITPRFLTINPKSNEPTFVVVHAKVARGAFAHWLIKNRITDVAQLTNFAELNYAYSPKLSTPDEPVFICKTFGGLGLSIRLAA